ncbi:MAG: hypothetical protein JWR10_3696 [Rubritepida sp.]|nr:hypothetical protein [Rubritepida sp.]
MLRPILLVLATLLLPAAAPAQSPTQPAPETRLRISESGSVRIMPDEISASLRVEVRAATAAEAQERVNRDVAAALAAIRTVDGVQVSTGPYNTHTDGEARQTVAQQSLQLRGRKGDAMQALVGRLQADGLMLEDIGWNLAEATARTARDRATSEAIRAVQARADSVARDLGLRVFAMRDLFIEANPEARPMMSMRMAAAPTAPSVTAQETTVTASVTADFLLRR